LRIRGDLKTPSARGINLAADHAGRRRTRRAGPH
jgi:hypothetical protein